MYEYCATFIIRTPLFHFLLYITNFAVSRVHYIQNSLSLNYSKIFQTHIIRNSFWVRRPILHTNRNLIHTFFFGILSVTDIRVGRSSTGFFFYHYYYYYYGGWFLLIKLIVTVMNDSLLWHFDETIQWCGTPLYVYKVTQTNQSIKIINIYLYICMYVVCLCIARVCCMQLNGSKNTLAHLSPNGK